MYIDTPFNLRYAEWMQVKIRLFAILREKTKTEYLELPLPEKANGKDVLLELGKRFPDIKGTLEKSAIAANDSYLSPDEFLPKNAEIAIIPPVSGGHT